MQEAPVSPVVPPELAHQSFAGTCSSCRNTYDRLYRRRVAGRFCEHCCDLSSAGVMGNYKAAGRGGGPGGSTVEKPRNQPLPITMHGERGTCLWCSASASPAYDFYGFIFTACGWGCAGQWMDWVMDQVAQDADFDLAEGEAYVRKSLGLA